MTVLTLTDVVSSVDLQVESDDRHAYPSTGPKRSDISRFAVAFVPDKHSGQLLLDDRINTEAGNVRDCI